MWHLVITELKQMIRMKTIMILLILAPLVLIFILGSALDTLFKPRDATWEPVTIAFYMEDDGVLMERFEQYIREMEGNGIFSVKPVASMEQLQDALYDNEVDGGLHIPSDFSAAVLSGGEASWDYYTGRDRLDSQTARMLLKPFLDEINRMQATTMVLGPQAMETAASFSEGQEQTYVEQGRLSQEASPYSAMQFYSVTMLVMFLLFAGMSASLSILSTKESHLLARLQATPVGMHKILGGKMAGQAVLACIQAAFIIAFTHFVYGTDWGEDWGYIAAISLLTICASMSLAFLMTFLFRSTKAAGGTFGTLIGIMTFISGGMMPIEGTFLERLQPFTLNYYAVDSFIWVMTKQSGNQIVINMGMLAGMSLALLALAILLYRKVGYHE